MCISLLMTCLSVSQRRSRPLRFTLSPATTLAAEEQSTKGAYLTVSVNMVTYIQQFDCSLYTSAGTTSRSASQPTRSAHAKGMYHHGDPGSSTAFAFRGESICWMLRRGDAWHSPEEKNDTCSLLKHASIHLRCDFLTVSCRV